MKMKMKMVFLSPSSVLQVSSSSSLRLSVKFKALLQTLILSLARVKTTALQILKQASYQSAIALKRKKNNVVFGSFRLHYNWCSVSSNSHVTPAVLTWDGGLHDDSGGGGGDQLSGYLQWLEEREDKLEEVEDYYCSRHHVNEIDKLAEIFIARSHEKFRLEKQESYRRFQECIRGKGMLRRCLKKVLNERFSLSSTELHRQ